MDEIHKDGGNVGSSDLGAKGFHDGYWKELSVTGRGAMETRTEQHNYVFPHIQTSAVKLVSDMSKIGTHVRGWEGAK